MSIIEKIQLNFLNNNQKVIIALSGGLDSVVLLNILSKILPYNNLTAIYINHKLQDSADSWEKFNAKIANEYNIKFYCYTINILKTKSASIEKLARDARYTVFESLVNEDNIFLATAHHLNDQAETFLLQLSRKSGPKGLSCMPKAKRFSKGWHIRPLLNISKQELTNHAVAHDLKWVEDITNQQLKYDRNYIRHKIIPVFEQRWPKIIENIAKSAEYCANLEQLLTQYIMQDYQNCIAKKTYSLLVDLDINKLKLLEKNKLLAVLRYWVKQYDLPMIGENRLIQILHCINSQNQSNVAKITIKEHIITRFKNNLVIISNDDFIKNNNTIFDYQLGQILEIKELNIIISSRFIDNNTKLELLNLPKAAKITIKFRQGQEICNPLCRNGSVKLKKLLQEKNIPPWHRNKIPLLYVNNTIASIINIVNCKPFYDVTAAGWIFSIKKTYE